MWDKIFQDMSSDKNLRKKIFYSTKAHQIGSGSTDSVNIISPTEQQVKIAKCQMKNEILKDRRKHLTRKVRKLPSKVGTKKKNKNSVKKTIKKKTAKSSSNKKKKIKKAVVKRWNK